MRYTFLLIVFFLLQLSSAWSWTELGHKTTVAVSEKAMSPKTLERLQDLLSTDDLTYLSTWADRAKKKDPYKHTASWHFANLNADESYLDNPMYSKGDVVRATNYCYKLLKDYVQNGQGKKSKAVDAAKFLLHFVADMHNPMHMGKPGDRGGNDIVVYWYGERTNLHFVWDGDILDAHRNAPEDLADKLVDYYGNTIKSDKVDIIAWADGTRDVANMAYIIPDDGQLGETYQKHFKPIAMKLLWAGGLHLAKVMNIIFDPTVVSNKERAEWEKSLELIDFFTSDMPPLSF